MRLQRTLLGAAMLAAALSTNAIAAPPPANHSASSPLAAPARPHSHASIQLDLGRAKAWVGQAIPVTLRAYFRDVEGVTLEGVPQLSSPGIFTSDLHRDPKQSTEFIGGEPVLVATWTGTITPSSDGPLAVSAELPVRVRYRDPAPRVQVETTQNPFNGTDPFDALAANPFDMSAFDRFFQQSMVEPQLGRAHEEAIALKASAHPLEVQALPSDSQPASFTGAIGKFDLKATVESPHAHVSEPVTLRVVVEGDGDLDRVDLAGVATSATWKTYPPKSVLEPAAKGKRARKVFEQVIVPLVGGEQRVPSVSFSSFDPASGRYVTRDTAPIPMTIDGTAAPVESPPSSEPVATVPFAIASPERNAGALVVPRLVRPTRVLLWLSPVALVVAAAAAWSSAQRSRRDRLLRRAMKRAAKAGDAVTFYSAAHALIESRFTAGWNVRPEQVTAPAIRARLGTDGDVLAEAVLADEALRFGRAHPGNTELLPMCSSIERSLAIGRRPPSKTQEGLGAI